MNFVNYSPLKEKLRERNLSDREALPYLIVFSALNTLVIGIPLYENYNLLDGISAALSVSLSVVGILFAYRKNGKENGYDLIQKYVVIGWIVAVRMLLIGIPLYVVVAAIGHGVGFPAEETNVLDFIYFIALEALFYYRIGKHIEDTRGAITTAGQLLDQ